MQTLVFVSEVNVLALTTWLTLGPGSASRGAYFSLAKAKQGKGRKLIALIYQQALVDHNSQYKRLYSPYGPFSDSLLLQLNVEYGIFMC